MTPASMAAFARSTIHIARVVEPDLPPNTLAERTVMRLDPLFHDQFGHQLLVKHFLRLLRSELKKNQARPDS